MAKKSEEEKIWLTQAESDYRDAKLLWENHRYGASVLFYQQAIEKIIKAYIVKYRRVVPRKSHRIEILLSDAGLDTRGIEEAEGIKAEELSKAYIRVRYPDLNRRYYQRRDRVEPLVKLSEILYIWVKNRFKKS